MKEFTSVILKPCGPLLQNPAVKKSSVWMLKQVQHDDSSAGFTLIELLVVVLIIGILSAVALPQYTAAVMKARLTEGVTLERSMITAQQSYFLANGSYTDDLSVLDLTFDLASNKTFTHQFLFLDTPACTLLDLHAKNTSYGPVWVAVYFKENTINCAVPVDSEKGNAFCKRYGSAARTCPCQPAYNCYEIH